MSISLHSENDSCVRTPFSLQHWSILAAVKYAIKDAAPERYRGAVLLDIPLFEDFKKLHRCGFHVLDYEFVLRSDIFRIRVPIRTLIHNWNTRLHIILIHSMYYCGVVVADLDTLEPFCDCKIVRTEGCVDRLPLYGSFIPYSMDVIQIVAHDGQSAKNINNNSQDHTQHCKRREFRY